MNNTTELPDIAPSAETGGLGIMHLKRFWNKAQLKKQNLLSANAYHQEWQTDKTLLSALGIGLEQCIIYMYNSAPTFEQLEKWIVDTAGVPSAETIKRFNNTIHPPANDSGTGQTPTIIAAAQLDFWDKNGYIIIKNAVPRQDCDATIEVICNHIGVERDNPHTWYKPHPAKQGIMVQLFQHPLLEKNRRSAKIRMAFEQLWQRTDIWLNTDRTGFNPPETDTWKFPGPDLHWDCALTLPIPFGLQGILYLADTAANQGAFTLVPRFQHQIKNWLDGLAPGTDPSRQNLHALGSIPITASAGDFIIWHHALPHGSSPNTSDVPRFVQYIKYEPANAPESYPAK
ncbi:phytanoyl-CoA dioxygenase family protein [Mucilaginibacter paludis]|nr:phytanoyl-CoA dioxygenase family protein [Mucilaginibacter paludis]